MFRLKANDAYDELVSKCGATRTCTSEQVDDSGGPANETLANAFLGVSVVAAVATVVLFFVDRADSGLDSPPSAPKLGFTGSAVMLEF